jgi:hypothetical protein
MPFYQLHTALVSLLIMSLCSRYHSSSCDRDTQNSPSRFKAVVQEEELRHCLRDRPALQGCEGEV